MSNLKEATDVWFIAFLMSQDIKIVKFDIISRGKVKCYFELTDEQWSAFKLKFNNSDVIKFKGLIDQIKDLGY